MHELLHGPQSLSTKYKTCFPFLADEIAEPRPDMNIKVAAFTVCEKSINTFPFLSSTWFLRVETMVSKETMSGDSSIGQSIVFNFITLLSKDSASDNTFSNSDLNKNINKKCLEQGGTIINFGIYELPVFCHGANAPLA